MAIVLASASPRRAALLRAAGFRFEVRPVDVDESLRDREPADRYVSRVATAKADAAVALRPDRVVLAADTVVVTSERPGRDRGAVVLGKPVDSVDAARMLRLLSGASHDVLTGVAVVHGARRVTFVDTTRVWFTTLTEADVAWYVASEEPMDKAGAYAIQGLASRFVSRIEGTYATVVGLPVARVAEALRELGVDA